MAENAGLDEEFKRIVTEMKPHARNLPQKSDERHKVTLWIKKLLGLKTQRVERNAYAKLLLRMLKAGNLEDPFLDSPPPGSLRMPETMRYSRSPSPTELDSLLMSSPEDAPPHPPSHSHHRHRHHESHASNSTKTRGAETTGQRRSGTHHSSKSYSFTSHTHIPNERTSLSLRDLEQRNSSNVNPLAHRSSQLRSTPAYSTTRHSSGTSASARLDAPVHPVIGRSGGGKSEAGEGGRGERASAHAWSEELFSGGVPESGFHPKLTSSLTALKEGSSRPRSDDLLSNDSLDSHEDLLEQELSLTDVMEVSPGSNGDVSDVTLLLQSRPKPRPMLPQTLAARGSHFSSYSPRVSFSSSFSQSPRKPDISRELLQAREVELKVKSAETRFQEEKLRIQRQHEDSLKQILDRKNNELEDMRSEHRVKVHQLEGQCKKLERKVTQLERECGQLRDQRDHHVADRRQSSHHHTQQLQAEFDKQLHAAITESEREKLDLEQRHSRQLQRVLKESQAQVDKMEAEYNTQIRANSEVISELEGRVQELTREAESMAQAHSRLAQEKVALEHKCSSLEAKLHETQETSSRLEGELAQVRQEKDSELMQLRNKMEQSIQSMQHQHSIQEVKVAEQVTQLGQQVCHWREALEDARRKHKLQTSELETSHQRQLREKEIQHKNQVDALKAEIKQCGLQGQEKQLRLENSLREREDQLAQLRMAQELQSQQAEHAIEDFKAQVEQQTSEMFNQMQGELDRLERELAHSRTQQERQARESTRQRQEDRQRAEKELLNLQQCHDQAMSQLRREHQHTVESLRGEQEKAKELALAKLSSALAKVEAEARAKSTHSAKVISSLEDQVYHLQQQLEERKAQHANQLVEERRSAEEEKNTAIRIHESAISKLKSELERQKAKIREEHRAEVDSIAKQHNHRIQQLEHDFAVRMAQTAETICTLQAQIKFLQEDLERQQGSYEDQLSVVQQRSEEERASRNQHHQTIVKSLQQELEASLTNVAGLEERMAHLHIENESKLSHLRLQCERRMKGMMPLAVKQEYEDTIKSLKAQVNILSQRVTILQEELDRRRPPNPRLTSTPLPSLTSLPTVTKTTTTTTTPR